MCVLSTKKRQTPALHQGAAQNTPEIYRCAMYRMSIRLKKPKSISNQFPSIPDSEDACCGFRLTYEHPKGKSTRRDFHPENKIALASTMKIAFL